MPEQLDEGRPVVPYATPTGQHRDLRDLLIGSAMVLLGATVLFMGILVALEYRSQSRPEITIATMILTSIFSLICLGAGIAFLFRGGRG